MRRASTSVALNGSEGVWAKAGERRSRLEDAVNSARETLMALRLAGAAATCRRRRLWLQRAKVDGVIAVLWVLAYRRALAAGIGLPPTAAVGYRFAATIG